MVLKITPVIDTVEAVSYTHLDVYKRQTTSDQTRADRGVGVSPLYQTLLLAFQ